MLIVYILYFPVFSEFCRRHLAVVTWFPKNMSWQVLEVTTTEDQCAQILYKIKVTDDNYDMMWTDLIGIYQERLEKNDIEKRWKMLNTGK